MGRGRVYQVSAFRHRHSQYSVIRRVQSVVCIDWGQCQGVCCISYFFSSSITADTITNTSHTVIHGALALEAAFLVAFKQLVPEHTVSLFRGSVRMRVKHFPAVFVLANSLSGPLLGTDTAFFLSWFGFLTSWIYLRFYRVAPSLATSATGEGAVIKGDASETFAFSHFFPERIQFLLDPACAAVYDALVAARVCTPFSNEAIDAGNEQAQARVEGGLPMTNGGRGGRAGGGRREEAERRRALALKALDQRLNAAAAAAAAKASAAAGGAAGVTASSEASSSAERGTSDGVKAAA